MKDALHVEINTIKKGTALRKLMKNLQKSALAAIEKCIGPKSVNLNLILKGNLFWETPSRRPPGPLQQKPGANSIFSLKPSTSGSTARCTSPKLLYPQAVPSRIPTGLFGPLPPQTFSLLLGQSSLT